MNYINTSHPKFIGESKVVEEAFHQIKSSRVASPIPRPKDVDLEKAPTSECAYVLLVERLERDGS
ncbi:hypothetical protein ACSBR1_007128 [Camellia fascicularis]